MFLPVTQWHSQWVLSWRFFQLYWTIQRYVEPPHIVSLTKPTFIIPEIFFIIIQFLSNQWTVVLNRTPKPRTLFNIFISRICFVSDKYQISYLLCSLFKKKKLFVTFHQFLLSRSFEYDHGTKQTIFSLRKLVYSNLEYCFYFKNYQIKTEYITLVFG